MQAFLMRTSMSPPTDTNWWQSPDYQHQPVISLLMNVHKHPLISHKYLSNGRRPQSTCNINKDPINSDNWFIFYQADVSLGYVIRRTSPWKPTTHSRNDFLRDTLHPPLIAPRTFQMISCILSFNLMKWKIQIVLFFFASFLGHSNSVTLCRLN